MGLLDVLNGMQNGPHGQSDPNAKGGMSPMTMAILALLAYKAVKHVGAGQTKRKFFLSFCPDAKTDYVIGNKLSTPLLLKCPEFHSLSSNDPHFTRNEVQA